MKKKILLGAIIFAISALCLLFASCSLFHTSHTYGEWTVESEGDCTTSGLEVRTCSVCGEREEKTIAPSGHKLTDYVAEREASCVEDGVKEHYCCSKCGKFISPNGEEISASDLFYHRTGHNLSDLVRGTSATCFNSGRIPYYYCIKCGQYYDSSKSMVDSIEIPKLPHTTGAWISATEPTCVAEGCISHTTCTVCNQHIDAEGNVIENVTIPKLSHDFSEWIEGISATCEDSGIAGHKVCSLCGLNYDEEGNLIDDIVIEKAGHRTKTVYGTSATCEDDGLITHKECIVCHKLFADDYITELDEEKIIIEKLGHDLGYTQLGHEATCQFEGELDHLECSRCDQMFDVDGNKIDTIVIPKTDHNYILVEGSDGEDDYYFCNMCEQHFNMDKELIESNGVKVKGHSKAFISWRKSCLSLFVRKLILY